MVSKEVFATNLKKYLVMNDMEGQDLAEQLGVSPSSVSGWINGKFFPRINYIEQMATLFHCQKSDLLEDKEKNINIYELTTEEYLIIKAYRETDEVGKEMVKRALNYYSKLNELERTIYEHK